MAKYIFVLVLAEVLKACFLGTACNFCQIITGVLTNKLCAIFTS
jgi:hypothetical protein